MRGVRHTTTGGDSMRSMRTAVALAAVALLTVVLAACGSSSSSGGSSGGSEGVGTSGYANPAEESLSGKKGGTLEVLQEGDFEHLDPTLAYYSVDYMVIFATQRPLYSNKPNTASTASPDIASGPPELSSDNKKITVHLREGVKFSPPVNREVTAEDVAYAFQRATNPNVANPYVGAYFKSIEGEPQAEKESGKNPIK